MPPEFIIVFNRMYDHGKYMPTISVNVPEKMRERIDELAEENMYSNTSEYIRAALRKQINEDTGLTPEEEEEIVAERLEKMDEREDKGKSLSQVAEEMDLDN